MATVATGWVLPASWQNVRTVRSVVLELSAWNGAFDWQWPGGWEFCLPCQEANWNHLTSCPWALHTGLPVLSGVWHGAICGETRHHPLWVTPPLPSPPTLSSSLCEGPPSPPAGSHVPCDSPASCITATLPGGGRSPGEHLQRAPWEGGEQTLLSILQRT